MTSLTIHPHQPFIGDTLPAWYANASAAVRQQLTRDMVQSQKLREKLAKELARLQGINEFARPLLEKALEERFGPGLDVEQDRFAMGAFYTGLIPKDKVSQADDTSVSLLQAALHNFHEEEVEAAQAHFIHEGRPLNVAAVALYEYPAPLKVKASEFMALCRELDLGGQYQAHLCSIVGPTLAAPGEASEPEPLKDLISGKEHAALRVQAHIAYMKNAISASGYRAIPGISAAEDSPDSGSGLEGLIQLLDQPVFPDPRTISWSYHALGVLGFAVRDVLVLQAPGADACMVYMPDEPDTPLREYASLDQFMHVLRDKLHEPAYRNWFMGFIGQRSKAAFAVRLENCLTPWTTQYFQGEEHKLIPRTYKQRVRDSNADLDLETQAIPYRLAYHFHFQKMLRIKDDARVLAVPTGDEDAESRRARLAAYVAAGMNLANFAALFIPLLGEAMMVVAGAQLLSETFQGVAAWSHGDMNEALEHLSSVAENLAFMAAFGALVKTGAAPDIPSVRSSSFVGKMVPIKLPDGRTRLWAPDLTPFAHDIPAPPGGQVTGEGLFTHGGKHYLPLDGKFYPVKHDPALNKWRVEPPRGEQFSPTLEHNGMGGWRHEGENPLDWDTRTAFKRLSPEAAALPESLIESVMQVTAMDNIRLFELHLNNLPPPPALADAIQRFSLDGQVHRFIQQMREGANFASANRPMQMEVLTSMPRWPLGRPIEVFDSQGLKIEAYGASVTTPLHNNMSLDVRPIAVTEAQIADGRLLQTVIDGLGESGQNRVFGRRVPRTPEQLAAEMAKSVEGRSSWLFDRLYQAHDLSADPTIRLIKRDFPSLPAVAVRELVAQATAEQLASITATQRVPLEIAGRARRYIQEIRINHALDGFYLASNADNPDTLKVALHFLERLPGWPDDLYIEIRQGAVDGPVVHRGAAAAGASRRVLIKRGLDYRAVDASGSEISPDVNTHNNFFTALLQALPETARQALGFPDPLLHGQALHLRIAAAAPAQRDVVARALGQWSLGSDAISPSRLADGRFGYALSGRGPFIPASPDAQDLLPLLRELYPEASDLNRFLDGLLWRTGTSTTVTEIRDSLLNTQRSFSTLRTALEAWADPPQGSTLNTALARRSVAESISRAWRSAQLHSPLGSSALTVESMDLAQVSDLPDLPEYFSDIDRVVLRGVMADTEQLEGFVGRFPRLMHLEIMDSEVPRLPSVLSSLARLSELSIQSAGLTVDQVLMDQLMELRQLSMLDLSGNRMGELTDAGRLTVSRLYLTGMQMTQWPEWTNDLSFQVLDVSDNQIVHLPQYLIDNEQGDFYQATVYAYGNPIVHSELRECWLNHHGNNVYDLEFDYPADIRRLVRTPTTSEAESELSSDEDGDGHTHSDSDGDAAGPAASVEIWMVEGREQLNSRNRIAWERIVQADDAPNLLILLQRLREAPDFKRVHEELANDVMRVLEAAADDAQLRGELEIMANDRLFGADQTCQDGARLIFSDIQVAVYSRSALNGIPEAQQTQTLFRVIRSLFRLNEVQAIADTAIAEREARGVRVDHAEVRMAYRIGLASDLSLPAQPVSMAWDRVAAVDRPAILDARRLVLQREAGSAFLDYALADQRWNERLRRTHQADLERVTAPITTAQDALLEHPPVDGVENLRRHSAIYERLNAAHEANDHAALAAASRDLQELSANPPIDNDEFDRQGRALIARREAAEKSLLEQITNVMRDGW